MRMLALALAASLAPAALAWWTGRRLARAAADPLLPELLALRQRQVLGAAAGSATLLLLAAPGALWWAFPLLVVGVLLGARPMRRALFDERLDVTTYLEHGLRSFVGTAGPWLMLALTPLLLLATPEGARPWAAVGLWLALVAWQLAAARVWLACHSAAPFDRRDVEPRLRDVAARSHAPMPRLARVGAPGLHLLNAWALPGTGAGTVAFSRRMLDSFAPDEIAAIFAHEMAHLEHLDARRVWRARAVAVLLATLTVLVPWLAPAWMAAPFGVVVLLALALRAARMQRHEAASDARAVELLGGDGEALARALTRLHQVARLPRRMDPRREATASHPSLARRIQAIEAASRAMRAGDAPSDAPTPSAAPSAAPSDVPSDAASGVTTGVAPDGTFSLGAVSSVAIAHATHAVRVSADTPPAADQRAAAIALPLLLLSPRERTVVALASDRLYWFEDVPDETRLDVDVLRASSARYRALRYADMAELRVAAAGGERQLIMRELAGEGRRVALHPNDVALAERALDLVDGQLGHAMRDHGPLLARLAAAALVLVALLGDPVAVATLGAALLALSWPSRATLAALGAAALATALLVPATGAAATAPGSLALAAGALGLVALLLVARMPAGAPGSAEARRGAVAAGMLAAGAGVALALLVPALGDRSGAERLEALAESQLALAAATLAAAAAAALLVRRTRPARRAAVALLALALVLGGASVAGARAAGAIAWREATAVPASRQPMPAGSMRVTTSPSGTRWAVQRVVARGTPVAGGLTDGWDWELGSFEEGRTRTVRALRLEFLDDARVVVVARRGDSLEVRLEPAFTGEDPLPRRAAPVPALLDPVLRVDRATGTWQVAGRPRPVLTRRPPRDAATGASGALEGTFAADPGDEGTMPAASVAAPSPVAGRPDTLVLATGRVGRDSVLVRRWLLPAVGTAVLPLPAGGVLYTQLPPPAPSSWRTYFAPAPRASLWRLGADGGRARLAGMGALQCSGTSTMGRASCVERDARRLRIIVVDAKGDIVSRRSLRAPASASGRPQGMQVTVTAVDRAEIALLDAAAARGTRALVGDPMPVVDAAPTASGFVALHVGAEGAALVSWRVPR